MDTSAVAEVTQEEGAAAAYSAGEMAGTEVAQQPNMENQEITYDDR